MRNLFRIIAFSVIAAMVFVTASCSGLISDGSSLKANSESVKSGSDSGSDTFFDREQVEFTVHVAEASAETYELCDMLENARPSVVEIYVTSEVMSGAGSGVIVDLVDSDGNGSNDKAYIVTCHHVIEGATKTVVKSIYDKSYVAKLIGSDPQSDIGLIMISTDDENGFDGLTYATWYGGEIKVGMSVVAIGNPLGILGGTVTSGIVGAINRGVSVEGRNMTLLQTDAAINGGNSGGGLFDAKTGTLVGIVNAGYASYTAEGLNFAIPCTTALEIERQLSSTYGETYGYVEGNYDFGVTCELKAISMRVGSGWSVGYQTKYYVYVSEIDEYGLFYKNGIRAGDCLYSVKIGEKVVDMTNINANTLSELGELLGGNYAIGDGVEVSYAHSSNPTNVMETTFNITQYIYGQN
ncbi:MAG: serine protease [Clostridia bacterium]|nr:serine protease [Clostridia bacterium]